MIPLLTLALFFSTSPESLSIPIKRTGCVRNNAAQYTSLYQRNRPPSILPACRLVQVSKLKGKKRLLLIAPVYLSTAVVGKIEKDSNDLAARFFFPYNYRQQHQFPRQSFRSPLHRRRRRSALLYYCHPLTNLTLLQMQVPSQPRRLGVSNTLSPNPPTVLLSPPCPPSSTEATPSDPGHSTRAGKTKNPRRNV